MLNQVVTNELGVVESIRIQNPTLDKTIHFIDPFNYATAIQQRFAPKIGKNESVSVYLANFLDRAVDVARFPQRIDNLRVKWSGSGTKSFPGINELSAACAIGMWGYFALSLMDQGNAPVETYPQSSVEEAIEKVNTWLAKPLGAISGLFFTPDPKGTENFAKEFSAKQPKLFCFYLPGAVCTTLITMSALGVYTIPLIPAIAVTSLVGTYMLRWTIDIRHDTDAVNDLTQNLNAVKDDYIENIATTINEIKDAVKDRGTNFWFLHELQDMQKLIAKYREKTYEIKENIKAIYETKHAKSMYLPVNEYLAEQKKLLKAIQEKYTELVHPKKGDLKSEFFRNERIEQSMIASRNVFKKHRGSSAFDESIIKNIAEAQYALQDKANQIGWKRIKYAAELAVLSKEKTKQFDENIKKKLSLNNKQYERLLKKLRVTNDKDRDIILEHAKENLDVEFFYLQAIADCAKMTTEEINLARSIQDNIESVSQLDEKDVALESATPEEQLSHIKKYNLLSDNEIKKFEDYVKFAKEFRDKTIDDYKNNEGKTILQKMNDERNAYVSEMEQTGSPEHETPEWDLFGKERQKNNWDKLCSSPENIKVLSSLIHRKSDKTELHESEELEKQNLEKLNGFRKGCVDIYKKESNITLLINKAVANRDRITSHCRKHKVTNDIANKVNIKQEQIKKDLANIFYRDDSIVNESYVTKRFAQFSSQLDMYKNKVETLAELVAPNKKQNPADLKEFLTQRKTFEKLLADKKKTLEIRKRLGIFYTLAGIGAVTGAVGLFIPPALPISVTFWGMATGFLLTAVYGASIIDLVKDSFTAHQENRVKKIHQLEVKAQFEKLISSSSDVTNELSKVGIFNTTNADEKTQKSMEEYKKTIGDAVKYSYFKH